MQDFKPGDMVRIKSGPFASFISAVTTVDSVNAVLVVEVEIFGRRTPVEVLFSEAEKVPQPAYRPPQMNLN